MKVKCFACGTTYEGFICPGCAQIEATERQTKADDARSAREMEQLRALHEAAEERRREEREIDDLQREEDRIRSWEIAESRCAEIQAASREEVRSRAESWRDQADARLERAREMFAAGLYADAAALAAVGLSPKGGDPGNIHLQCLRARALLAVGDAPGFNAELSKTCAMLGMKGNSSAATYFSILSSLPPNARIEETTLAALRSRLRGFIATGIQLEADWVVALHNIGWETEISDALRGGCISLAASNRTLGKIVIDRAPVPSTAVTVATHWSQAWAQQESRGFLADAVDWAMFLAWVHRLEEFGVTFGSGDGEALSDRLETYLLDRLAGNGDAQFASAIAPAVRTLGAYRQYRLKYLLARIAVRLFPVSRTSKQISDRSAQIASLALDAALRADKAEAGTAWFLGALGGLIIGGNALGFVATKLWNPRIGNLMFPVGIFVGLGVAYAVICAREAKSRKLHTRSASEHQLAASEEARRAIASELTTLGVYEYFAKDSEGPNRARVPSVHLKPEIAPAIHALAVARRAAASSQAPDAVGAVRAELEEVERLFREAGCLQEVGSACMYQAFLVDPERTPPGDSRAAAAMYERAATAFQGAGHVKYVDEARKAILKLGGSGAPP